MRPAHGLLPFHFRTVGAQGAQWARGASRLWLKKKASVRRAAEAGEVLGESIKCPANARQCGWFRRYRPVEPFSLSRAHRRWHFRTRYRYAALPAIIFRQAALCVYLIKQSL